MTTTKTSTGPKALPWNRYSEVVDRQIVAGIAREAARGPRTTASNGTQSYRDASSGECYTVGYGGERNYSQPALPNTTVNGASEKQSKLIDALLTEREHEYTEDQVVAAKSDWRETRKMIDFLLAAPRVQQTSTPVVVEAPVAPARERLDFSAIPDGNYAVGTDTENDPIKFYRVSTNGQWKNVQVRASDELHSVRGRAGIAILHKIVAAGIEESRMLFATRLERCFTCGRHLTDKESREAGQGPDCRSK